MTFADFSRLPNPNIADPSPFIDRRTDNRVQTVFRVARVTSALDEGLARIRNLSDQGARLRMMIPLMLSDILAIELGDGVELIGQVVWKEGEEFGLQFDQPINCADVLATLAAGTQHRKTRPVRLPLTITALTRSERGLRLMKVLDISQRGLKLVHNGSLREGLHLKITLSSGLDRCGIVRWTKDDIAGIMLLDPLSVEALGSVQILSRPAAPIRSTPLPSEQAHRS